MQLQEVGLPVVTGETEWNNYSLMDSQIGAGYKEGLKSACMVCNIKLSCANWGLILLNYYHVIIIDI